MKFYHITPSISTGDAIANDIFALQKISKSQGTETEIYSDEIRSNVPVGATHLMKYFPSVRKDDIIFFHLSGGSRLNTWINNVKCKKIMVYHNITPPYFFKPYDEFVYSYCKNGLEQTKKLKNSFDMVFTDSDFNKQNLLQMGYDCNIKTLPVLIPFSDYDSKPDKKIVDLYNDEFINILFVGRIAPNKCQHDVIEAFDAYQRNYNPASRLILVGSAFTEKYLGRLRDYVSLLGTKNVCFTGHIRFDELLAYYTISDIFLCQSEHEGFCVPLLEAMYFHKPIIAFESSAIGETLGDSAIVLKKKNPLETAGVLNRILTDTALWKFVVEQQDNRLKFFSYERIKTLYFNYMDEFLQRNES